MRFNFAHISTTNIIYIYKLVLNLQFPLAKSHLQTGSHYTKTSNDHKKKKKTIRMLSKETALSTIQHDINCPIHY